MTPARRAVLLASMLIAALVGPAMARANTYDVYVCRLPDGTPAPGTAWEGPVTDTCMTRGEVRQTLPAGSPAGTAVVGGIDAPEGTIIRKASLWRWFETPPSDGGAQWHLETSWEEGGWLGGEFSGDGDANLYVPPLGGSSASPALTALGPRSRLETTLSCVATPDATTSPTCSEESLWRLHKLDIRLDDQELPTLSPPTGDLFSGWATGATAAVDITAGDKGAGLLRAFIRVDGTTVYAPLDPSGGCIDAVPGNDSLYEYTDVQPCPTETQSYQPRFALAPLGDGVHEATIGVEDAAGNQTPAATRTIRVNAPGGALRDPRTACGVGGSYDESGRCIGGATVADGPPPAGTGGGTGGTSTPSAPARRPSLTVPLVPTGGRPTAPQTAAHRTPGPHAAPGARLRVGFAGTKRHRLVVPYGRRVTVTGRLTRSSGAPIAGARVGLHATPRGRRRSVRLHPVRTGTDGRFRVTLAKGPSRVLRIRAGRAQARKLVLRVRTGARLTATPRRLRNGHAVTFHGRVAGAPRHARKVVDMQVRQDGHWLTFATTRLRHRRFTNRYRFERTYRPTRYVFRAIVRTEKGWPYDTGASKRVAVHVRP